MLFILLLLLTFNYFFLPKSGTSRWFRGLFISLSFFLGIFLIWRSVGLPLTEGMFWFIGSFDYPRATFFSWLYALLLAGCGFFFYHLKAENSILRTTYFTKKQWLLFSITILLVFFGFLAFSSVQWAINYFANLRIDQIMYTLSQPLTGSDPDQIRAFLLDPLLFSSLGTAFLSSILYFLATHQIQSFSLQQSTLFKKIFSPGTYLLFGLFFLSTSSLLGIQLLGFADVRAYFFEQTELYEKYYVDPAEVQLTFPQEKRNLIHIYMESMESSYASQSVGGNESDNLIPHLTTLALEDGIHFSNREALGGMIEIPGANQTASSLVAQTSGLPLRTMGSVDANDYAQNGKNYLPGIQALGDILKEEGYQRVFLMGSDAAFASRDKYLQQHGDYEIRDYHWAKQTGRIPEDYHIWWGYEDAKLFDYAKETLAELSSQQEPFAFSMLTADTHFEDGLMTPETPRLFDRQYSDVIHFSDQQTKEFLDWIQTQPFYENTTIILSGDHLTMDRDFFEDIDPNYQRSVYNVFLNTGKPNKVDQNRRFNAVDMFPSTLAALGVEIPGNRLGIGTNLFSDKQTLMEELGQEKMLTELNKRSTYYEKHILQGTDVGQ